METNRNKTEIEARTLRRLDTAGYPDGHDQAVLFERAGQWFVVYAYEHPHTPQVFAFPTEADRDVEEDHIRSTFRIGEQDGGDE